MVLKTKTLGFDPDNNMFYGFAKEADAMGLVTFGDDNKHTKQARQKTDDILENDKGYTLLQKIGTRQTYEEKDILYTQAFQIKTNMWCLLWYKFLIEALEADGYKVLKAPQCEESLTENAIVIE